MSKLNVSLGDLARDNQTGFEGKVVCVAHWLNGCARITIQPLALDSKGQPMDWSTFDHHQIELLKDIPATETTNGGPFPEPATQEDPI